MPLLILVLHVSPISAIGTGLLFMAATKIFATLLHWRQRTVDFRLAGFLAIGSVPGALTGTAILGFVQSRLGGNLNHFLQTVVALSLISIASLSLIIDVLKRRDSFDFQPNSGLQNTDFRHAIWIGLLGGLLVSITSVGSGSLIILLLLMFCRRDPVVLVGTDIFHGLILATVAALAHMGVGRTDLNMVGFLLVGSVVGVPVGTYVATRASSVFLRRVLLVLAAAGGVAML
jgi:uncharacterized protein